MKTSVLFILMLTFLCFSQEELQPWERLGLSITEWKMIEDNKMPMEQVEELLQAGIGISEYFQKPWLSLNMTEKEWIGKKRSGMSSYDIELQANAANAEWKDEMKSGFHTELSGMSGHGERFSALLPGYQQLKNKHKTRGIIMVSLAAGAVTWCTAGSIANKRFEAIPIACILVPDIIWSFIDYSVSKKKNK